MSVDVWLELTKGYRTVIDAEDEAKIGPWKWTASLAGEGRVYAVRGEYIGMRNGRGVYRRVYLHRVLMDAPDGAEVDHADGDTLNNRRASNLRIASRAENARNVRARARSGLKGAYQHWSGRGRWYSSIKKDGVVYRLGKFDTAEEAAKAYDAAAVRLHGAFAKLNFPEEARIAEHINR